MMILWLNPVAWIGLITLAVPVVIHLLTKQQSRRTLFPTLRFLRSTRLAAIKHRTLQNWPLLVVRMLMLAGAVAALAAPVFVSDARKEAWQRRVARAIVVVPGAASSDVAAIVAGERRESFASAVFRPSGRVADGLRDASLWLHEQPPSAREVVVVGDLKRDGLVPADVPLVPAHAGLRFLPVPTDTAERTLIRYFEDTRGLWRADVTLPDGPTRVDYQQTERDVTPLIVRAAPEDEAAATAALEALLARGIDLGGNAERQVMVLFEGGDSQGLSPTAPPAEEWMREALAALPDLTGGARAGTLVVETRVRASAPGAVSVLERIARVALGAIPENVEPSPMPAPVLAAWSRPPGAADERNVQDEGDRRWLWGAVLVLMGIEAALRRSRRSVSVASAGEARVA